MRIKQDGEHFPIDTFVAVDRRSRRPSLGGVAGVNSANEPSGATRARRHMASKNLIQTVGYTATFNVPATETLTD